MTPGSTTRRTPGDLGAEPDPDDAALPWWSAPHEAAQTAHLVREKLVRRLVLEAYVDADVPDCPSVRARAVALALSRCRHDPATCVVGYRSAAWVHAGGDPQDHVDVVIAPGTSRRRSPRLATHEHRLSPVDVQHVDGVAVTTPIRTAVDLARSLPVPVASAELDQLARSTGVRAVDVLARIEAMAHGRGVARAREVVHAWAAAVASR
jgi:hypothetical protein